MKWTTSNVKNPNYTANHELFVGTHTGSFKRLVPAYEENPFAQRNLQDLRRLEKDSRITALAYGIDNAEILIGRANTNVVLHSLLTDQVEHTVQVKAAPVVGLARYAEHLIAGFATGQVQRLPLSADVTAELLITAGDEMASMRQCPVQRNLIATGGKGRQNNLKVFDMAADGKQLFTSKNLPNDYLQLEVPVWDSDVSFIDSPHILATCSRHGYVRVYDTRKQRRPVQCYATEEQMSFATLVAHDNYIYTGTTMGALKAFDIRRMKTFVHTYKGFTGGISHVQLDASGKYLASASLDRYVRVHHVDSTVLLYQCYVKSKATRVLIRDSVEQQNDAAEKQAIEEEEEGSTRTEKQRKQDKAALSEDEEYEEIFENMQTVCDKSEASDEDEAADDADIVKKLTKNVTKPESLEGDEVAANGVNVKRSTKKVAKIAEVDNTAQQQPGAKRKANTKTGKNKKKKH